jgi:hypothetical protein
MQEKCLEHFKLVGGTALALKLGHRTSVDIDLFSNREFKPVEVAAALSRRHNLENVKTLKNSLFCRINGIKIDLIPHPYPLVSPVTETEGIRMLSLEDIGAMKLHAIVNSGERLKDYADVYTLLEHYPLKELYAAYEQKYFPNASRRMAQAALLYHDDIDFVNRVDFLHKQFDWKEVRERIKSAVLDPSLMFSEGGTTLREAPGEWKRLGLRL